MLTSYNNIGSNISWVVVRVWLPKKNGQFVTAHEAADGGNVGHASLQTKDIYASFWPDWEAAKKSGTLGAFLGKAKGVMVPKPGIDIISESQDFLTKEEDEVLNQLYSQSETDALSSAIKYLESIGKQRDADVIVVLNTLDVTKINKVFEEFRKSSESQKWSLMGSNVFNVFNSGGGQSCSGLVYDLLNAGGAEKLASWDMVSKRFTVAPDSVARFVVQAASSKLEIATRSNQLPPGINTVIKKPSYDLNPHQNGIGYWMGKPGKAGGGCQIS